MLVFVDCGIRMVVAPVEPVILQCGDAIETFSLRGSRRGAALEVPLAGGEGVEQGPVFLSGVACVVALKKEFGVSAVDPADEDAKRFAVGAEGQKQWRAVDVI